ncbi:hypothetical protein ACOJQI_03130 [Bacillus salacetis]|uniref:hypothetical protein n=1 Tax=Bacillus salacetis TaxID=2315464 RepID=UPI003BA0F968
MEDWYYKVDEKFLICSICGYHYDKYAEYDEENNTPFRVEISGGYGSVHLETKKGDWIRIYLDGNLSAGELKAYKNVFENCNKEKSYLMTYEGNGFFTIHFGNPPEHFLISFKEYLENLPEDRQNDVF